MVKRGVLTAVVLGGLAWAPVSAGPGEAAAGRDRHGDPLPHGAVARIGTDRFRSASPYSAAFIAGGKELLIGGTLFDPVTGREVGRVPTKLPGTDDRVQQVYPAGDGRRAVLTTARWDGTKLVRSVVVWDLTARKPERTVVLDWYSLPDEFVKAHKSYYYGHVVRVAPGGGSLVMADNGGNYILWKLTDRPVPVLLPGVRSRFGNSLRYTADGRSLVTVGERIQVWDAASGKPTRDFPGTTDVVTQMSVSPDGRLVAVVAGKRGGQNGEKTVAPLWVKVWDLKSGAELRQLTDRLTCCQEVLPESVPVLFTPDGKTVVVIDEDRKTRIQAVRRWELPDGKPLPVWSLPSGGSGFFLVSPDGRSLLDLTQTGARTFDLGTGEERSPDDLRLGVYYAIGVSADSKQVITASPGGVLCTWEAETGKLVAEEKRPSVVAEGLFNLSYSPDVRLICVDKTVGPKNDRDTVVYDRATGELLHRHRGERCGTFGPDGTRLFTITADYKSVIVRDAKTGKLLREVPCQGNDSFFFSPDGRVFGREWGYRPEGWDAETGEKLFDAFEFIPAHLPQYPQWRLPPDWKPGRPFDMVWAFAVSPGADRAAVVATRAWDDTDRPPLDRVVMFDPRAGKLLWEAAPWEDRWLSSLRNAVAAFSPDGRTLAVGGVKRVALFDAATGKVVKTFDGHRGSVSTLRFTPDGKRLVAGDSTGTVLVWDTSGR